MLKVGKSYKVNHSRKGKFILKVTHLTDTWATGVVAAGKAEANLPHNEREQGESVTLRIAFCKFEDIT